jgi:Ca-activated chloride channel family protein
LLSDGRNDSGRLRPLQAARLARRAGVPVYTIALGSPQGMRVATEAGSYFIDPPDAAALRAIAAATGGRFATAASAAALRGAYTRLGRELGWRRGHEEISSLFAAAAAALLVAAGVLSTIWAPRLP